MMEKTNLFTGKAKDYSKYRPHYPEAFIDYFISAVGFGGDKIIADIGAGTGILTGQMLAKGLRVIGVEPNADMRQTAEAALGKYPAFTSVAAAAEDTTLDDSSIDLITVAQAFHWFDTERFKAECQRILKPEGQVILVWNNRDEDDPVTQEVDAVCKTYCPLFRGFSGGKGNHPKSNDAFFKDENYELRSFQNPLYYDLSGFIGRNLSSSYAPKRGDVQYDDFVAALTAIFNRYHVNGILSVSYVTESFKGMV